MDHLPAEVLHEIFIKLDLKERLKCMLVCRFWYNTLDKRSLLHDVDISSDEYPKFKDMLEWQASRANQVEYLTLQYSPNFGLDKRKICNMFSNLRAIKFCGYVDRAARTDHYNTPFHFIHSTSNLEVIEDFVDCSWIPQLAMSNLCNNLKTLELDFGHQIDSTPDNNIVPQLKNMPVLQNIKLRQLKLKLTDLETMHQNLPSITSLELQYVYPTSGQVPRNVKPATLITKLKLQFAGADNIDTHIQFYQYTGNKYPSVSNPNVFDTSLQDADVDSARRIYNEGILPLYQKIGSQVDFFLFINYCDGLDAFRKFDSFGMKLKEAVITSYDNDVIVLEELAQSQQRKYIQTLTMKESIPARIDMLIYMEALETLRINSDYSLGGGDGIRKSVNLSQLIAACPPNLTNVIIQDIDLTYNGPTSNLTSIQHLKLDLVDLTPDLAKAIETSFPKLSTLELCGSLNSNMTISLLKHDLKEVKIRVLYDEEKERKEFSAEINCHDGVQYHTLKRNRSVGLDMADGEWYKYSSTLPGSEQDCGDANVLALNFVCSSVENLYFCLEERDEY